MRSIVVIVHDIRSTHNIGSLLRTAEGLGVQKVYLTGYSPYPKTKQDQRLPHIAEKLTKQIHKTALGAETNHKLWQHHDNLEQLIDDLKDQEYEIVALEQARRSTKLPAYHPHDKVAILLGREVEGLEPALLERCDVTVEIPMFGRKESFNVTEAASMALYHCRFYPL